MASMRASETQKQTLETLEQNRMRITSMRASETSDVKLHKRRKNKEAMVNARTRTVLIESAIAAFHSEVKLGPEFVCTCFVQVFCLSPVCTWMEGWGEEGGYLLLSFLLSIFLG